MLLATSCEDVSTWIECVLTFLVEAITSANTVHVLEYTVYE